ncbi:MAG: energy transducer TonB [Betaproteobacteria bacterium]|nr:energy transducer TonB [Betaproteobacteria bacterium]
MKSYRETQRNPVRHLPSVIMVGLLHVLVGYALVSGLARKVVEVIKAPLETKIIEEIKKALPDTPPPPPPKLAAPPPPFIPPPEVNIQVPVQAQQAPTITTVTTTKPPPGPPPKAAPPAPPAPPAPVVRKNVRPVGEIVRPVFPRQAIRDGIQSGSIVAHLVIRPDGTVSEVRIIRAKPPRIFDREVIRALSQWRFAPEAVGFIGEVDIDFKLTD